MWRTRDIKTVIFPISIPYADSFTGCVFLSVTSNQNMYTWCNLTRPFRCHRDLHSMIIAALSGSRTPGCTYSEFGIVETPQDPQNSLCQLRPASTTATIAENGLAK